VPDRARRRRDDNDDDDPRPRKSRDRDKRGARGRPARADEGRRKRGRPEPRASRNRADDRRAKPPAQKRSARSSRDADAATRSGIRYPPRRTRSTAPGTDDARSQPRRPVLRTVKGGDDRVTGAPRRRRATKKPAKRAPTHTTPHRRRRTTVATDELARVAGRNAKAAQEQLARAAEAFTAGRERDAARLLRPLRDAYPDVAAVRELLGLVHYRLGQYPAATKELVAFADLTGSVEQHPVLMDCWRAQRRYDKVADLWDELAQSSPSGALVTEGRIVLAGAQADQGHLQEAIATLARRADDIKRVQDFHVRLWYALADLYERAGEIPRAREYFGRVRSRDPAFADVAERLAALA
jgi:tetratricopeptide (TPR) repeat protein